MNVYFVTFYFTFQIFGFWGDLFAQHAQSIFVSVNNSHGCHGEAVLLSSMETTLHH